MSIRSSGPDRPRLAPNDLEKLRTITSPTIDVDRRLIEKRAGSLGERLARAWYHCDTMLLGPIAMANLLVRNLDEDVLKELKAAAKAHGRSLQAEIHEVLRNASAKRLAETRRLSARWLKRLRGSTQSDSAALIREDRDTR